MGKIIFVHGIGDLKPDYWHEWLDRVADAIGTNKFDPNSDYGPESGKRSLKALIQEQTPQMSDPVKIEASVFSL